MKAKLLALFPLFAALAAFAQVDASGFFGSASVGHGFDKGQGSKGATRVGSTASPPHLTVAAEAVAEAYDTIDDCIAVPVEIIQTYAKTYELLSESDFEAIMKRVDARWPEKVWIPRKISTWLGSAKRVMDFWEKMGYARKAGEIGGMVFLGLKDGKTPEQIFDLLIDTGTLKSTDFGAEGEFAFLGGAIMAGLVNGESFVDSIDKSVDPENMSVLGKIGYGWGYITSQAVIGLEKFLKRNERARLEQLLIDNIRKAGYNEEAEKALLAWLALDDSTRAIVPFELKDEWKTNIRPEDMVCATPNRIPETAADASSDDDVIEMAPKEEIPPDLQQGNTETAEPAAEVPANQSVANVEVDLTGCEPKEVVEKFIASCKGWITGATPDGEGDVQASNLSVFNGKDERWLKKLEAFCTTKSKDTLGFAVLGFASEGAEKSLALLNSVKLGNCTIDGDNATVAVEVRDFDGVDHSTELPLKKLGGVWKIHLVIGG